MQQKHWLLLGHPAFKAQLNQYLVAAIVSKSIVGEDWKNTKAGKKYIAALRLVHEIIPRNPGDPAFRLGKALGPKHSHWFRAKFFQQYRIFFRYSSLSRVIVYGWMNNESTKRAYESKTDAYAVFKRMLEQGKVPNNWDELIAESEKLN